MVQGVISKMDSLGCIQQNLAHFALYKYSKSIFLIFCCLAEMEIVLGESTITEGNSV